MALQSRLEVDIDQHSLDLLNLGYEQMTQLERQRHSLKVLMDEIAKLKTRVDWLQQRRDDDFVLEDHAVATTSSPTLQTTRVLLSRHDSGEFIRALKRQRCDESSEEADSDHDSEAETIIDDSHRNREELIL